MSAVRSVGIVGAGCAGTAAAIALARGGVSVDLFDAKPALTALGSGITIQGNACRVLAALGVWETVQARSYAFDETALRAPDPEATVVAVIPDARTGGPDFPAVIGMYRPDLAQILVDRATEVGVTTHWGAKIENLTQDADGVDLVWDAGAGLERKRFDLVVGADGLHSTVRALIGIDVAPRRTGMGIWRAFVDRPADVVRTDLTYGGSCYIAGYCPTGEDTAYAYLVEDAQDRTGLSNEEQVEVMRALAASYHGPWDTIRDGLSSKSRVNYTWFTTHLIEGPWNRGRVVVIGDAAHTCPPTVAQGAAMALEDGAVLAEMLLDHDGLDDDLWSAFLSRRLARARTVIDASVQLGDWMLQHDRDADVPGLMRRVTAVVSQPA
jgi:2-polyprenyl-6-methoxyphenol hydroxylase-like FAD-dependent oxidoreductase